MKPGDRVYVKSIKDTATVLEIQSFKDFISVIVSPDNKSKFAKILRPEESVPSKETLLINKYYTFENDLKLIDRPDFDPDWKDIWEENSN